MRVDVLLLVWFSEFRNEPLVTAPPSDALLDDRWPLRRAFPHLRSRRSGDGSRPRSRRYVLVHYLDLTRASNAQSVGRLHCIKSRYWYFPHESVRLHIAEGTGVGDQQLDAAVEKRRFARISKRLHAGLPLEVIIRKNTGALWPLIIWWPLIPNL